MTKYITEKSDDYSVVDNHTGEILDLNFTKKITLDEFIMVFFSSCPELMNLTGNHLKVLICCWKHSSYNPENEERGNILHNGPGFKSACRENGLDISNAAIDNAVSALCKKGFLIKKFRGEYLLNPQYFFKGRLSNRSKVRVNYVVEPEEDSNADI
jgi:hypothetical protein